MPGQHPAQPGTRAVDGASAAAHLLMFTIMAAMLLFPSAAPPTFRAVLLAVIIVLVAVLATRLPWPGRERVSHRSPRGILYHLATAAAMLVAMSAHQHDMSGHHHGGLGRPYLTLLAVVFVVDAVVLLTRVGLHWVSRARRASAPTPSVPRLVMDLGTAYMLVAMA